MAWSIEVKQVVGLLPMFAWLSTGSVATGGMLYNFILSPRRPSANILLHITFSSIKSEKDVWIYEHVRKWVKQLNTS